MTHRFAYIFVLMLAAGLCQPASATDPAETSTAYTEALFALTARIRAVKALADGCGEEFPEMKAARAADYDAWRTSHEPLVVDVERRMTHLGGILYKPDEGFERKQELGFQELKGRLVKGLRAQGKFVGVCNHYPSAMAEPIFRCRAGHGEPTRHHSRR